MKKKILTETIDEIDIYNLTTSLPNAVDFLNNILIQNKEKYTSIHLGEVLDGYDGGISGFKVIGTRMENDEEFKKRKEKAKKISERAKKAQVVKLEKELKLYQKLHKKYGNT